MVYAQPWKDDRRSTQRTVLPGAHILQIYTTEHERKTALLDAIGEGLAVGERTYCISDQSNAAMEDDLLGSQDISLAEARDAGTYRAETSREFYLQKGVFDPERICKRWHHLYSDALAGGCSGLRAVAELLPELDQLGNGTPLVLYETRLNAVFQASPPSQVICQYNARAFSGWTIMGVLKAHPLVLVERTVLVNPFYTPSARLSSH